MSISANGGAGSRETIARVTLRPIGSSLPLGAFALVPSGLLLSGMQLGWFAPSDSVAIGYLLVGFAFPLQLLASVLAFLGRDALVGTGFGVFAGFWLAFGLVQVTGSVGMTSDVLGVFFLSGALILALLMGGGIVGGKTAAGGIILMGSARFILGGLYELTGSTGLESAAGIVGLVFVAIAGYVGLAAVLEDTNHGAILPLGRRGRAKAAFTSDLAAQTDQLEHEAGVRDQL